MASLAGMLLQARGDRVTGPDEGWVLLLTLTTA